MGLSWGDLLLTPDISSGRVAGLCTCPSVVLDGSSACACASELLVRHSGVVSARLASTSIVRTDGGKMETAGKDRMSQCLSGLLSANT